MRGRNKNSRFLIFTVLLTGVLLTLAGGAWAQPSQSGKEGVKTSQNQVGQIRVTPPSLPDGDYNVQDRREAAQAFMRSHESRPDLSELNRQKPAGVPGQQWMSLERLDPAQRANARIELELGSQAPAEVLATTRTIAELWNGGQFDRAIAMLRNLEEVEGYHDLAIGTSWVEPVPVSGDKWISDIRVGPRENIYQVALDYDPATGNLFALVLYINPDGYYHWAVNISYDGGLSWSETYDWGGGAQHINAVDGQVSAGYFYVAYTHNDLDVQDSGRMRRMQISNGASDGSYGISGWISVFTFGIEIEEVSLATNIEYSNDRHYYMAILVSGHLSYYFAEADATTWYYIYWGVSDASEGLSSTWDTGYDGGDDPYFLFVTYTNDDGRLNILRNGDDGFEVIDQDDSGGTTSVGAWDGVILVAFEFFYPDGLGIKYWINYENGDGNWLYWSIADPGELGGPAYFSPAVAARGGSGFGVFFQEEVGGEPDFLMYRQREYAQGSAWSDPVTINQVDVYTGSPTDASYLPPMTGDDHAHGVIWISSPGQPAYFDRNDWSLVVPETYATIDNEPASCFTLPNRGGQPLAACYSFGGGIQSARIELYVYDAAGDPVPGIPASDMWLISTFGNLVACPFGTIADGPTNASGWTQWTMPLAAGHPTDPANGEFIHVVVSGNVLPQPPFEIAFNSADMNGDLIANLSDVVIFAGIFFGAYSYAADFYWDGNINLSDVVLLAQGLGATCPPAAKQTEATLADARGDLGIYFNCEGTQKAAMVEPYQEFAAHLMVTGPIAADGIRGWQTRLSMSENIVVRDWEYAAESMNLKNPPEFIVGVAPEAGLPSDGLSTRLLTMTLMVTDDKPAHIYFDGTPVCATGEDAVLSYLDSFGSEKAGSPVAYINDENAPLADDTPDPALAELNLRNAPNPFNPSTEIKFNLAQQGQVELQIYDASGRLISRLAGGQMTAGPRSVQWNGTDQRGMQVASGIYFYKLFVNGENLGSTGKMSLIK